ncbi:MAG: ABC transporter ATP-binding protein/permease [Micrococcales bacterium]|nr:ABC transporter ATP-binding protein/permease [Micrococcales bacterium]
MGKGAKAGSDTVKIVFSDLMPAVMQAVVAAVTAFTSQWQVGLVLLASGAVSTGVTQLQLHSQGGVRVAINKAKSRLDGVMTELLRGKAVIRTLKAADAESHRVGRSALELSAVEVRHHKAMGLFDAAKTFSESVFSVVVLLIAAGFVAAGANAGLVLTLYLLFMQFANPLRDIHRIRDELNESTLQLAEVFRILTEPLDALFTRPGTHLAGQPRDVEISHVRVAYADGTLAVDDVSVSVPDGHYLGICGPAGCGKSTLVKALVGILPLSGGRIRLGGIDATTLSIDQLTDTVAYVSQEPYTVSGTVRDNVLLGQETPLPDAALASALTQVGLFDELKSGLETVVGEDGQGLSGGQK